MIFVLDSFLCPQDPGPKSAESCQNFTAGIVSQSSHTKGTGTHSCFGSGCCHLVSFVVQLLWGSQHKLKQHLSSVMQPTPHNNHKRFFIYHSSLTSKLLRLIAQKDMRRVLPNSGVCIGKFPGDYNKRPGSIRGEICGGSRDKWATGKVSARSGKLALNLTKINQFPGLGCFIVDWRCLKIFLLQ